MEIFLTPLSELIINAKKVGNLHDLRNSDLLKLEAEASQTRPNVLLNELSKFPEEGNIEIMDDLIDRSLQFRIDELLNENRSFRKHEAIELIIKECPLYKDRILKFMKKSFNHNIDVVKSKLDDSQNIKFEKALAKEDLKDLETLNENRNIDAIKAIGVVNRSHNNLLKYIKKKSSEISLRNNLASTSHVEDTMNLFELIL